MKVEVVGDKEEYWFPDNKYGVIIFSDDNVCYLSEGVAVNFKVYIENAIKTFQKLESGEYVLVDKMYLDYLKDQEKELGEMRKRYG